MTELIATHPIKITVLSLISTCLFCMTISWRASSTLTEIKVALDESRQDIEIHSLLLNNHESRITIAENNIKHLTP